MTLVNHHCTRVLPFHPRTDGATFILERKDPHFKEPFFDSGFCYLGGNSQPGDASSKSILERELQEELWMRFEGPESYNDLLGEDFIDAHPGVIVEYSPRQIIRIKELHDLIGRDMTHVGTYLGTIHPPIVKEKVLYTGSVFAVELTLQRLCDIQRILAEFHNRITPDNLKWGSTVESVSLDRLVSEKFAWEFPYITRDLMERNIIPKAPLRQQESMKYIESRRIPLEVEDPTKADFENLGFTYEPRNW